MIYQQLQGNIGIPKLYEYNEEGKYNILVLELLGKYLDKLFKECHRIFTVDTTFMLADQMVFPIRYLACTVENTS